MSKIVDLYNRVMHSDKWELLDKNTDIDGYSSKTFIHERGTEIFSPDKLEIKEAVYYLTFFYNGYSLHSIILMASTDTTCLSDSMRPALITKQLYWNDLDTELDLETGEIKMWDGVTFTLPIAQGD